VAYNFSLQENFKAKVRSNMFYIHQFLNCFTEMSSGWREGKI